MCGAQMPNWPAIGDGFRVTESEWTVERVRGLEDLDDVLAVEEASFFNPWTRAMFSRELKRPETAHIFVVRGETSAIAGYCLLWIVREELHITNLAVSPAWRRRGAARALLRHVLREGRRLGAQRATLEVRRSNHTALQLYETVGFATSGVRPRYYTQPTEDAVVLWRRLETAPTV